MLNVDSLKRGIVIDHIKAGSCMDIYKYLELDKLDCSVAIIKNAKSNAMGKKDIIKVEGLLDIDLDVLGFIDCDITVNVIDDGKIVLSGVPKEVFSQVDKMKGFGLDVPQVTELAYELRKMGIEISDDVLTVDECFDEIIRILGETKR